MQYILALANTTINTDCSNKHKVIYKSIKYAISGQVPTFKADFMNTIKKDII